MMNRKPHGKLSHRIKNKKIYVTEADGSIMYNYIINPIKLECQCMNGLAFKPGKPVCQHLEYYLCLIMKIPDCYLPVLSVPRVRSKISLDVDLKKFCYEFLTNELVEHCIICHEAYWDQTDKIDLYQCPKCFELFHQKCHHRWKSMGVAIGCPKCKYI